MSLRTPITLAVLLAVVVGAGWYGWSQFEQPFDNPFADSSDACVDKTLEAGQGLHRNQVLVNVYNAGTRNDLASSTLEDLAEIGFLRGVSENAPRRVRVSAVTVVDKEPSSAEVSKTTRVAGSSTAFVVKSNVPRVPVPEVAVTKCVSTTFPVESLTSYSKFASKVFAVPVARIGLVTASNGSGDSTSTEGVCSSKSSRA